MVNLKEYAVVKNSTMPIEKGFKNVGSQQTKG
jgi:hypothetical protein